MEQNKMDDIDFEKMYSRGVDLYNAGNYAASLEVALQTLELEPERPKVFRLIGFCYHFLGQSDLAVQHFQEVLKRAPLSEEASEGLYLTLTQAERHKEAMAEVTRFLRIAESDFYRYLLVGILTELKWAKSKEDQVFNDWKAELRKGNTASWDCFIDKIVSISERASKNL